RCVLMTADAVGGVWPYAVLLSELLAARGASIVLATMGESLSRAQRERVRRIRGLEIIESRFRPEWMEDPWTDVERAGEWLLAIEDRTSPEIIHLNGYVHATRLFRAPTVVVAHSCVLSRWRAVHREEAPRRYDHYRDAVARGARAASLVVAPTAAMLASL